MPKICGLNNTFETSAFWYLGLSLTLILKRMSVFHLFYCFTHCLKTEWKKTTLALHRMSAIGGNSNCVELSILSTSQGLNSAVRGQYVGGAASHEFKLFTDNKFKFYQAHPLGLKALLHLRN